MTVVDERDGGDLDLELAEFRAGYLRGTWVLDDIDLQLRGGQVLAVVGPNGAGKSTLLKGIMRLVPNVGGQVRLRGTRLEGRSGHEIARAGVALVHEGRGVLNSLTVEENLLLAARLAPAQERQELVARVYDEFPILSDRRNQTAGLLSGGEQQMLAIARAVVMRPSVVLMDEPSLGLAPKILQRIALLVADLRHRGLSVLLVEQNVQFCRQAEAESVVVLRRGRIVHEGELETRAGRDAVKAAYLTSDAAGPGADDRRDRRG